MFEIEKGIPIPDISRRKRASKYGWERMEVGDSIFTATKNPPGVRKEHREGKSFVSAPEERDGVQGWRVWRAE